MSSKYSCGSIIPSSCVPFTGKDLKFLTADEQPACDANIDDVIDKVSIAIDNLNKATDVSTFTSSCVTVTSPKTVKSVLVNIDAKLCALSASLAATATQVNNADVANELVTIDLGSLAAAAAPCQQGTNTYSLISILTLLKNEIIAIKEQLAP